MSGIVSGGIVSGGIVSGGIVRGGIVRGGIVTGGIDRGMVTGTVIGSVGTVMTTGGNGSGSCTEMPGTVICVPGIVIGGITTPGVGGAVVAGAPGVVAGGFGEPGV